MNKLKLIIKLSICFCIAGLAFSFSGQQSNDYLKQGFLNPPDSARPGVYWYFMDGNIEREAMTKDLESMKKAGIGYVLFLEVNVGIPRGKVDFLSEDWQELFKHAVRESERLGIRLILGSGPGWAGSGGPWVTPAQSMMHLVASETKVSGPLEFNSKLPVPEPKKPFFGENSLTPSLKKLRNEWYEDVAVLAFPTPRVSAGITNIDEKALYYRAPYTSQKGVLPYLPSGVAYNDIPGSNIDKNKIIDITDNLQKDGTLVWSVPEGKWTIMRFGKRNNGAVTRPAPEPGLGFECDKFDTASFDAHYNAYVGKLIDKVQARKVKSGGGWTMIHIDSWEMGSQNWSPDFRQQFIKRRGYDPLLYLPVYSGQTVTSLEISERFLWDLRQTSNELIIENHAGRFKELGRRNGFRLSIEPYDMNPASDLDLGGVADVPMCEFWSDGYGYNSAFSCIEASSIAHTAGLPVVAAEAFTAEQNEAWKKYPGDMKNQGDWAFCMGINRLVYHTFAHKPFPDKYRPGMTMGPYGVHWDRGQTWWGMADGYHKYISRCQYVLSQGKAVADILYLNPEGAPQVFLPPASALEGTAFLPDKKEYSFDACSPTFLIKNASVSNGMIVFPGGASYKVLVLPLVNTMTPELLGKIESLVNQGANVIGNPPQKSPSLVNFPRCDIQVRSLSDRIWGASELPDGLAKRQIGKGTIWWGSDLVDNRGPLSADKENPGLYPDYSITRTLLENAAIRPDFISSGSIRYIHRSLGDREIYFISNRTGLPVSDTCIFREGSSKAELWDPVTGEISRVRQLQDINRSAALPLELDAWQSYFVVFYPDRNRTNTAVNPEKLPVKQTILTLDGSWNASFDTTWGGPSNYVFTSLSDWTKSNDKGIKYYSGTVFYNKAFDIPQGIRASKNAEYYLDLGKVKNIARVILNGKDLGVVWTAPWQVKITGALRNKGNTLEIEVANLWINRLIGDEAEKWDGITDRKWPDWLVNGTQRTSKRYTFTTHRYYKKDDPLAESGLLGPVTIRAVN